MKWFKVQGSRFKVQPSTINPQPSTDDKPSAEGKFAFIMPRCERSEGRSRDAKRESKGCEAQGGRR